MLRWYKSSHQKYYFNITDHLHHYQRPQRNWVTYWERENGWVRISIWQDKWSGVKGTVKKQGKGSKVETEQSLLILVKLSNTDKTFHIRFIWFGYHKWFLKCPQTWTTSQASCVKGINCMDWCFESKTVFFGGSNKTEAIQEKLRLRPCLFLEDAEASINRKHSS